MPNYTYDDVLDRWDKARAFGETRGLPEYAQHLNELYDTQDFSAGLRDGPWTRFSHRADQVLKGSVGQITGPVGEAVGGIFGHEEAGRRVGEDLPRALLETAPLYLAGPEAGVPATAMALGLTGGLMGAHTYADTGSTKASLISGVTGAALPSLGHIGGGIAAKLAGAESLSGEWLPEFLRVGMPETFGGLLPKTAADVGRVETSRFVGSQLAQFAGNEASMYAMHRTLSPNEPFDPLSADFLLQQIPFTVHDAYRHYTAPHNTAESIRPMLKQPDAAPPEPKPYVPPVREEHQASLDEALQNVTNVYSDPKSTPEERSAAMDAMIKTNLNPEGVEATKEAVTTIPDSDPAAALSAHPSNVDRLGNGNYRVRVEGYSGDQEVPEHKTMFVNGVEPTINPTTGHMEFSAPESQFRPATSGLPDRVVRPDPNQPELPQQPSWTPGEYAGGELPEDVSPPLQGPVELREPEQKAMVEMGVPAPKVLQLVDSAQKSNNLMLDSFQGPIHKDVNGNVVRLGNTTIASDGWMDETRFVKATQLPLEYVEAMRQHYPEAFQNGRVNTTALVKGLQERPMVEMKELRGQVSGVAGTTEQSRQAQHELETRGYRLRNIEGSAVLEHNGVEVSPEDQPQNIREWYRQFIDNGFSDDVHDSGSHYSFLGPKSEQNMPGYVEGLVRVPVEKIVEPGGVTRLDTKYTGPHFGNEDRNVLAFYRGYEDVVNGKKVFHVIEVQSDWGQQVRSVEERHGATPEYPPSHPLLPFYETLALKAALQHAQKIGAEGIVLSDAETAMMTEGHDKNISQVLPQGEYEVKNLTKDVEGWAHVTNRIKVLPENTFEVMGVDGTWKHVTNGQDTNAMWAQVYKQYKDKFVTAPVAQSSGMRLHYDATLPETLAKLTGEKGVEVGMGTHKGAEQTHGGIDNFEPADNGNEFDIRNTVTGEVKHFTTQEAADDYMYSKTGVIGSPVFKNAEGKPKTEITGRLFSLDKISGGLSQDDTLSLKEAVAKHEQAQQKEVQAKETAKTPLTDARQIASIFGDGIDTIKGSLVQRLESGATESQAVVHEVMRKLGMDVHEAQVEQEVQQEEVHRVVNLGAHGQEPNKYGPGIKNENGDLMQFPSESKAMWYLEHKYRLEHPEDKNQYEARPGGGKLGTPEFQGYRLVPKENIVESMDKTLPSGKETKQDILKVYSNEEEAAKSEAAAENLESRPQPTLDLYLRNLDVASRSPQLFARASGLDLPDAIRAIRQARVVLSGTTDNTAEINAALEKAGVPKFADEAERNKVMAAVRDGLEEFGGGHPARMLEGAALPLGPEGEKIIAESGVLRGGRHVVQWLAARESDGIFADMMKAFGKFPQLLDQIKFVLPGMKGWEGQYAGYYQPTIDGGEIHINNPLPDSVDHWASVLREEITHHMEDQLSVRTDPAAMEYKKTRTDILNALRTSKQLPKKIRDYIQTVIARGDYTRYAEQGENYTDQWRADLGDKDFAKYHGILYALQNETEMVGGAFSNKNVFGLMASTKPPKGVWKSVMDWFSEAFGRMSGASPNALHALLSGFDNYLSGGVLKSSYNGKDFIRDALVAKYGTQPEALASRMQAVDGMYRTGDLHHSIAGFVREAEGGMLHPNQETGPLVQSLRTSLVSGEARDVFHGTMDLLAGEVPVHQELWYRMKQDFEITKELLGMVKRGEVEGSVPEVLEANLRKSQQKINAMSQAIEKQGLALERWNNLDAFEVDGYEKAVIAAASGRKFTRPQGESGLEEEARGSMGLDNEPAVWKVKRESSLGELEKSKAAKVGDWFRKAFMQTQFLKQQVPEARAVFDHVSQQQADANSRIYTLNLAYNHDPDAGRPTDARWENNVKVANEPRLFKPASDLKRWINEQEQNGQKWSFDDSFAKNVLGNLSKADRESIITEINSARSRNLVRTEQTVPKHLSDLNIEKTAFVIAAREPGMKPEQAREVTRDMYDALAALQNPETATTGMETLRMLSSRMQPATYLSALKLSQELVGAANHTLEIMRSRPNYTSEQRLQQYHLRMTGPNGETYYSDADTTEVLNARRKSLEAKGYKFNYFTNKADANVPTGDLDNAMFSAMQEMDSLAAARVQSALSDQPDVLSAVLPELQRANDYQASLQAAKPIPGAGPKRKFVAGREEINMVKNDHEFQVRFNNYLRHSMTRAQSSVDMLDPEIQGNAAVKQLVQDHVSNFLSPDNPTVRKFNEYTYYTKLAWNFGVNFLHGVQSLTTGMASVIAETGGVGDAMALTAGAQKAFGQKLITSKWENPEHKWLIDHAVQEGVGTGIGSWAELYDPDTLSVQNMNKPMNPIGKGLNFLQQGARKWTGMFLKFNDQVGLLAGFDLGRSRGMSMEDAYNFAVDVKNRGYYTGGKAQRSVGMWSIKTKAVPQLMSSLQTYTLGWFSQLANNYINGFGTAPRDLTPTQRLGAKKAFLYQLGAQAVLAGALGLPGVGQGLALLKQVTGEDVKGMAQQGLAHLFDEDADAGGMLSTLAMHGAVASLGPIDPSMRHMPSFPFIGVSPYKGFDLSALAPAPVSTAADLVQGLLAAAHGDVDSAAQKTLPHVLQGPYKLWQGEGDIRDKRGSLLYSLSPTERFVTALGMEPASVARAKDTAEAVKRMQASQEQLLGSLADDVAHVQRTQGVDASRQRLRELVQQNSGIDPVKLASEAVNRLVAQTVQAQPQRLVNPTMDLTGLTSQVGPQESQRFQVRQQGRVAFGLPADVNPTHQIQASLLDDVMQSNPYLPVSTARAMVSGKQQVRRPYSGLDILGTSQ